MGRGRTEEEEGRKRGKEGERGSASSFTFSILVRVDGVFVEIAQEQRILEDSLHRNRENIAKTKLSVLRQFLALDNLRLDLLVLA